ncbi:MAG: glycosyltransferase N-terminal domain-containing protein [Pseudomonadota bacterium]
MQADRSRHIWCDVSPGIAMAPVLHLLDRIIAENRGVTVTLTAARGTDLPADLRPTVSYADRPIELRQSMEKFIAENRPQVAVFAGSGLMPSAIDACASAGTATVLVCGDTQPLSGLARRWKEFRLRSRVRRLDHLFANSSKDAQHLRRLGAEADRIEILGPLEEAAPVLHCDEQEWDALASLMSARPAWLAALALKSELPAIEEAQRAASRMSHRLLLIVVPRTPNDGPAMARWFQEQGWQTGLRSDGAEPEPEIQVYIADEEAELGLWYRLAPISFIGSTLTAAEGGGHNPGAPAALGSAILHGPYVADFEREFGRLSEGGGTRLVASGAQLGSAVSEFLSPDRAAKQAHRAWETTFQGAEASDRVVSVVSRLIRERVS